MRPKTGGGPCAAHAKNSLASQERIYPLQVEPYVVVFASLGWVQNFLIQGH
jgi:hypothetical protein